MKFFRSTASRTLASADDSPYAANRVAEANGKHRLPRILEDVDDLLRRSLEIQRPAIRQQVIVRRTAYRFCQPLAEFLLQESHDVSHSLQREPLASQFADDGNFREILERIDSTMPITSRNHEPALVPPLQLPRSDASQSNDVAGCEAVLHLSPRMFKTFFLQNV